MSGGVEAVSKHSKTLEKKPEGSQRDPSGPIRILLIDDDKIDRQEVALALEASGLEYELTEAATGAAGLEKYRNGEFDCVLLDYRLPGEDGIQVLREMAEQRENLTAVIGLTRYAKDGTADEMLRAGASDYLTKDEITPRTLHRALRYALARKEFHEHDVAELKRALAAQQGLTGWQTGATTAQLYGAGPLHARAAAEFAELEAQYETLLDSYLEALGFREIAPPRAEINRLADRIGALGGGPRDVVDLHLRSVAAKASHSDPKRARALTTEGRLLALEIMGNLVDYYRMRRPRRSLPKEEFYDGS